MTDRERRDLLNFGGEARFVRWHQNRDGDWYPEVLHGRFQSVTREGWLVEVDGSPRLISQDVWSVYRAERATEPGRVSRA